MTALDSDCFKPKEYQPSVIKKLAFNGQIIHPEERLLNTRMMFLSTGELLHEKRKGNKS